MSHIMYRASALNRLLKIEAETLMYAHLYCLVPWPASKWTGANADIGLQAPKENIHLLENVIQGR